MHPGSMPNLPQPPLTPAVMPSAAFEPPKPPASDWPLRVLALIPLVGLALLWSNHHLGLGAGYPEAMAAVAAVLPVALGMFAKFLEKAEQDSLLASLRKLLARHVTWLLVLVLYFSLGAVALTWSSVLVLSEEGKAAGTVTLRPLDEAASAPPLSTNARDKGESARFVVASQPFGRPFSLHVDGYVPQIVDVYPVLGLRVRPSRDLQRTPSLLVRLSGLHVGAWEDTGGAILSVMAIGPSGARRLLASTDKPAWALLLGRGQAIPTALAADWRSELVVKDVHLEKERERHLVQWRRPRQLDLKEVLDVGTKVRVELVNAKKSLVAEAEFFIGREELQDQALEDPSGKTTQ